MGRFGLVGGVCDRIGVATMQSLEGWRSWVNVEKFHYQRGTPAAEKCGLRVPVGHCAAGWGPVCSTNA